TDIRIERFYPEYLIDLIRESYNSGTMANPVLIEHLKHLRDVYIDLKGLKKLQKKKAKEAEVV
ncbi:MAG: hypothetical protein ACTSRW_15670, partial [Candidatus Helarchaeota archaeon]